jgi:beta-glucuronidase
MSVNSAAMKKLALVFSGLLFAATAAAEPSLQNVFARQAQTLNGKWHVIPDPYENGYYNYRQDPHDAAPNPTQGYFLDKKWTDKSELLEYDFDTSPTLMVPGDWNSQEDKLFYYEGTVWYRTTFEHTAKPNTRQFLYFGAANYQADVYFNGKKLGRHVGGFTPFEFEVTGKLRTGSNSVVVKVDNARHKDAVPTVNTDWWNYGGLTRDVLLVETPAVLVRDYEIGLAKGTGNRIAARVQLDGARQRVMVTLEIPAAGIEVRSLSDSNGEVSFDIPAGKIALWSPESPKLYDVRITGGDDVVNDRIGFRRIEVKGTEILLNGKPQFLRGISLHEENPIRGGRAYSVEDARTLLGWAKELGCNFVRLAHYPHNEHMARVADEMGLMLWEEVPVYWTIQWENPATLANAKNQLTELITRDRNRASVIIWSVANETPVSEPRTRFLKQLVDTARALDATRLVSAAMEVHADPKDNNHRIVDDPFGAYTDILSFNQYIGWYDGLPDKLQNIRWTLGYQKPVMISEFGADALQGMHGERTHRFTEEFQQDLYKQTLAMLGRMPQWRGTTPWILVDFRSPRRPLPHIQDGWNRKGLIGENGVKKQAFYTLRDFYLQKAKTTP